MFKKNFELICAQKGVAPTAVCKKIGLTGSAYSLWTEESIPRKTTLIKLANELGVTVEELLEEKKPAENGGRAEEFTRLFESLTPEQQDTFLAQIRWIADKK
jgi:transcriptional regulator with XRE-family HTH domain